MNCDLVAFQNQAVIKYFKVLSQSSFLETEQHHDVCQSATAKACDKDYDK
jgi:hypothetical protein